MKCFISQTQIYTIDDRISGLDFDPLGASVASIDEGGVCLISDLDTDEYRYHIEFGGWGNNFTGYHLTKLTLQCAFSRFYYIYFDIQKFCYN